jgi:hypothetical protein
MSGLSMHSSLSVNSTSWLIVLFVILQSSCLIRLLACSPSPHLTNHPLPVLSELKAHTHGKMAGACFDKIDIYSDMSLLSWSFRAGPLDFLIDVKNLLIPFDR